MTPDNAAVTAGSEIVFNCGSNAKDEFLQWRYSASDFSISSRIFFQAVANKSFGDRFSVIAHENRLDLRIVDTHMYDAGSYTCKEPGTEILSSAELIVIGKFIHGKIFACLNRQLS